MGFTDAYTPFDLSRNPDYPRFTDHLPPNAEQVLRASKGVLRIDPDSTSRDLAFLEPIVPLIQAIWIVADSVQDISALVNAPGLRSFSSDARRVRGIPPGHVWPLLENYGGPYTPELDAQLSSGTLTSIGLSHATDQAFAALQGTMFSMRLYSMRAETDRGWPGVECTDDARVLVYRSRSPLRLNRFEGLGGTPFLELDALHSVEGLDVATRTARLQGLELGSIKDVICEGTIWDIRAERIVVLAESKVPTWLARDWGKRPKDWEKRWVINKSVLRKLPID